MTQVQFASPWPFCALAPLEVYADPPLAGVLLWLEKILEKIWKFWFLTFDFLNGLEPILAFFLQFSQLNRLWRYSIFLVNITQALFDGSYSLFCFGLDSGFGDLWLFLSNLKFSQVIIEIGKFWKKENLKLEIWKFPI